MQAWSDGDIFVIGAGSMAEALIRGVVEGGVVPPQQIVVQNRSRRDRILHLCETYGVRAAAGWSDVAHARWLVVATKPADAASALQSARPFVTDQVILSFAAGITLAQLSDWAGGLCSVVRTMPNIPVSVGAGMTAVCFADGVQPADRDSVGRLLEQLGSVAKIDESLMDAATALSGSGPGLICFFLEGFEQAAVQLGFTPDLARTFLLQTLKGTAQTLDEWGLTPAELREKVTSPGGTTFAGLEVLHQGGVAEVLTNALAAAARRSVELSEQAGIGWRPGPSSAKLSSGCGESR